MKPSQIWEALRSSLWFVPTVTVLGAIALALGLVGLQGSEESGLATRWPHLFGAGPEGARSLLSTIASSMITIAGVVFSITIVVLSLAATQYTSRVLRNFMRDLPNQVMLGAFVGVFAYCIVVLRTIRGPEGDVFVPTLAVTVGLLGGLLGIAVLVVFIHHIARSVQASHILASVWDETSSAIERLFPDRLEGDDRSAQQIAASEARADGPAAVIPAKRTGYLQQIDTEGMAALASEVDGNLWIEYQVGDFLVEGTGFARLSGVDALDEAQLRRLDGLYAVGQQRTLQQDIAFGIRQLVDVALKALSPSMNDTTSAVMAIEYLSAVLIRLADRQIACAFCDEQGQERVSTRGPTFADLVGSSFDQVREAAEGNATALEALLEAVHRTARETTAPARRRVLDEHLDAIREVIERTIDAPVDKQQLLG